MKRALLVVGPFVVTLAAALYFFGVFERHEPEATPTQGPVPTDPTLPTDASLQAPEPTGEPEPDVPSITSPVRVLVLAEGPRSFTAWCLQLWRVAPQVEWQAWYATPPPPGLQLSSDGLPPLTAVPTTTDVDGAQVLFLAALDPSRLPAAFWAHVAERVTSGRLGLLVVPDHLTGRPFSDEPSLRSVLPVASVLPLAPVEKGGRLIPGVFETPRAFEVTPDGAKHPATRIVPFEGWSAKIWGRLTRGKDGWSTKFVSPVERVAPGARTLLEVVGGNVRWPAVVASQGDRGRVLWVGGLLDIDWSAYRSDYGTDRMRAMMVSWVAWLAQPRT
jgi:hypothetical protein